MQTFSDYLKEKEVSASLASILSDLASDGVKIFDGLKLELKGKVGSQNISGDEQIKMDVYANDLFVESMHKNKAVCMIGSEEEEKPLESECEEEGFSVAFDPLDGSSLADVNLSVGSIIGVYKGKGFIGRKGRDQVASMIIVHGPRLTFMVSVGSGVDEFIYKAESKEYVLNTANVQLKPEMKMFAPGNLRAAASEEWYFKMLERWVKDEYKLRYSGGMVPDVNQILRKGGGVFTYPGYKDQPKGKLRLVYECNPIAFLIEQAGGKAISDEENILDIEIEDTHQRTPIFMGSTKEVDLVMSYLKNRL